MSPLLRRRRPTDGIALDGLKARRPHAGLGRKALQPAQAIGDVVLEARFRQFAIADHVDAKCDLLFDDIPDRNLQLVHYWSSTAAAPTSLPYVLTILDGIALAGRFGERGDFAAARQLARKARAVMTLTA